MKAIFLLLCLGMWWHGDPELAALALCIGIVHLWRRRVPRSVREALASPGGRCVRSAVLATASTAGRRYGLGQVELGHLLIAMGEALAKGAGE